MARLIIFFLIFLCSCADSAFALEAMRSIPHGNLIIRQERYTVGSISVSRPIPLDEKILNTLIVNSITSLEPYLEWLSKNIIYQKDGKRDAWAYPEETLKIKRADCEDFAFLNEAVLRVMGYEVQVLAMGGFGGHHAFCLFKEKDYYSWIDNSKLKRTKAKTISEFAKHIFTTYGSSYLLEVDLETKDMDILFKRSELLSQR